MSNLDLHELRYKLKFTHESTGVSKSVAMKLMQELEEARAKGRKEWGRANKAEQAVARVRDLAEAWHVDSFAYDSNALNGTLTINVSDAAKHVARALDGE